MKIKVFKRYTKPSQAMNGIVDLRRGRIGNNWVGKRMAKSAMFHYGGKAGLKARAMFKR